MSMASFGALSGVLNRICLAMLVLDLALNLSIYRLRFLRDGWNIFDFVLVAVSLAPAVQS